MTVSFNGKLSVVFSDDDIDSNDGAEGGAVLVSERGDDSLGFGILVVVSGICASPDSSSK